MADKKHILYVQTSGIDTPVRLYWPFFLGTTAKAMNIDATIYFTGQGVTVVKKGAVDTLRAGGLPPVKKVMDQAIAAGVRFLVCEQSARLLFNLDKEALIEGVKLVGAATLNDLALDADTTMWF